MIKKILSILLTTLLFIISLVVFLFFLIPLGSIATFTEHKVNTLKSINLSIGDTERSGVGTFVFRDIEVQMDLTQLSKSKAKKDKQDGDKTGLETKTELEKGEKGGLNGGEPAHEVDEGYEESASNDEDLQGTITIDELELKVDPLDLLSPSAISVGVRMELMGGEIGDAEIWMSNKFGMNRPRIYVGYMEGLDLSKAPLLSTAFSALLPNLSTKGITGTLESGSLLLEPVLYDSDEEEDPDAAKKGYYTGDVSLKLTDLVADAPTLSIKYKRGPNATMKEDFQLTDLKLGDCSFNINIGPPAEMKSLNRKQRKTKGTVVMFEKGECRGESIDYVIRKGSFLLFPTKKSGKTQIDLWTKMAFSSDYFKEKTEVDGVVVSDNDKLDKAIRFQQQGWEKSRDVDGYYWMHCLGSMAKSSCKRGLPPEEKARKDAEKDRKNAEKKEEALKKAAEAKSSGVEAIKPAADGPREKTVKRPEAAERTKDRNRKREPRAPRPPVARPVPRPGAEEGVAGEDGDDEALEPEGEEPGVDEGEEGDEPLEEGDEPAAGDDEGALDDEMPAAAGEEGVDDEEGAAAPEGEGEHGEGEVPPAEGEEEAPLE